jgi:predicted ribosomally synthesized peptide with nif11-like leader
MSENQLELLLERLKSDSSLRNHFSSTNEPDALLELLKQEGFSLSLDELNFASHSLTDQELESLAGGNSGDCTAGWGSRCCSINESPEYCKA